MTITDFISARLDEDEAVARAASPGPWHPNTERDQVLAVDDITVADGFALSGPQARATTEHIALHDPARVLAEVEAKRRIVGEHTCQCPDPDCGDCGACSGDHHADPTPAPCTTVRLLALPYADHPDYREEWRP